MRIAMYMPNLGPDALGWRVHVDFARAVEARGHRFELLTTPPQDDPGDDGRGGGERYDDNGPHGDGRGDNGRRSARDRTTGARTGPEDADPGHELEILPVPDGWRRLGPSLAPLLRNRWLPGAAAALRPWLRRHGDEIDLLHLEVAYPHGTAALLAARAAGWNGPVALTPMGEDVLVIPEAGYGFRRHRLPRALVRWTLRRATCIRSLSPLLDRHIAEIAPDPRRRVIPLSVSREAIEAADRDPGSRRRYREAARQRLREEMGLDDRPLVLSFGRLHPFKGIDVLVRAMRDVEGAQLLIVGPSLQVRGWGDVARGLLSLADELGIADRVHWAGPVPHERALETLAAADAVAVPSHLESLNKVCMEAAAVGTPFVVTRTTGISAWVPDEGVGLTVPPDNPAALAWGLSEILDGHFRPDAAATRDFALQFGPDEIAGRVLDFYETALEAGALRRSRSAGRAGR